MSFHAETIANVSAGYIIVLNAKEFINYKVIYLTDLAGGKYEKMCCDLADTFYVAVFYSMRQYF